MLEVAVHRIPMRSPDDVSGIRKLLNEGILRADEVKGVVAKTEGNGCVNDFTRGFALREISALLASAASDSGTGQSYVMSGGTEGIMSPHVTIFTRRRAPSQEQRRNGEALKALALGAAETPPIPWGQLGRTAMVEATAQGVRAAMAQAGISDVSDIHYVQLKCPLLTPERIEEARACGSQVVTTDCYRSMAYSRGAAALGVALAIGEIQREDLSDTAVLTDWRLNSGVASASAGVELDHVEILLLGNSADSASNFVIGHAVMADAIDASAIRRALRSVGIALADGEVTATDRDRVVNVFAKAEADPTGQVRGRRHTMLSDSDIQSTRHARAVVSAVVASIVGDPMVYVSGGAEHQGPAGGGPVAVIARIPED